MSRVPLFNGEHLIGEVVADEEVAVTPEDHILIIRLNKQAGLVKELMKEELVYFDIIPLPAQQGK
ncbi:hypothetical protein SEA_TOKKI_68 [Arthrobacter phage Tokki]|nr:hypothetical protein PBI_SHEPARD_65 [Arthrobacter phage Shepard]UGL63291.1 hypothetical protein SEA_TOKKI_68 [Arthrobacter phage Tokki]UYL88256.1 hypothetical protein SEA_LILHUDDY_64 [Arthrobacter phage LilHuddy]